MSHDDMNARYLRLVVDNEQDLAWDDYGTPVSKLSPMQTATAWLELACISFEQPTDYQIKIDKLSYYPNTGTINFDGRKREPVCGLASLREILQQDYRRELAPIA